MGAGQTLQVASYNVCAGHEEPVWGEGMPGMEVTGRLDSLVCELERLFKLQYDLVFLQELGHWERGAHDSVKVPANS